MKGKSFATGLAALAVMALQLLVAGPASAYPQGFRQMARPWAQPGQAQPNPLARLVGALQQAGATPLSSDQASRLDSLITSFQSNRPKPGQNPVLVNAQNDYENAVLSGNANGVAAASAAIAAESSKLINERLLAVGQFEISALGVLTSDQVAALKTRFGSIGLNRELRSLTGGPGAFGMRGFGPAR